MPLLIKDNKILNMIHIPRTGGRWVVEFLASNGYRLVHGRDSRYWLQNIIEVEIMHYHADLMQKGWFESYSHNPSFAIIRNPLDRFISSLPHLIDIMDEYNIPKKYLFTSDIISVVTFVRNAIPNNWFRPQHEFMLPNTEIWRYEDKLDSEFYDWLNASMQLNLKQRHSDVKVENLFYDNRKQSVKDEYFNDNMIRFVKEYYREDYLKYYPNHI